MNLPDIREVEDIQGKRVFLRASLNVPIVEGEIVNTFRLERALPTIAYLKKKGAKIILAGHIGREKSETLESVYKYFLKHFELTFLSESVNSSIRDAVSRMNDGDVVLLENLRKEEGETTNDCKYIEFLASLSDIYVNDAFSASHRKHASIVGVPQHVPSYAGLAFQTEVEQLLPATNPDHPALFILGGAKFDTKQPLIEKFLDVYEHVFIGGALANVFFKAHGFEVGKSLLSSEQINIKHLLKSDKIVLPVDVVVEDGNGNKIVKFPHEVLEDENILDAGPATVEDIAMRTQEAKFILWNGPLGSYERGFNEQTEALAQVLAKSDVKCVVGGGDTIAAISKLGLFQKFSFVSTGGGAMLEYLLRGTLPGIEALGTCLQSQRN